MPAKAMRKKLLIFTVILLTSGLLAGLAIVQAKTSSISLDSPVSFPVDI